jgi:hypothetical protein
MIRTQLAKAAAVLFLALGALVVPALTAAAPAPAGIASAEAPTAGADDMIWQ